MDDFAGAEDGDEETPVEIERGMFLLGGGGPVVPSVDYGAAWLRAEVVAEELNALFDVLDLHGDRTVFAVGGWSDSGSSAVVVRGTLDGMRELRETLARGVRGAGG